MSGWRERGWQTVWPALAGLAQAASIAMAGQWSGQGWLQVLSLTLLAAGLARHGPSSGPFSRAVGPTPKRRLGSGGVFATAWLAGTFWWLYVSMHQVGGLPAPLAVLAVLALAAALALYYAAASALWVFLARGWWTKRPAWPALCLRLCGLWPSSCAGAGSPVFLGAPGGYAHVDSALVAFAPWVGVYGMGAMAAWLAMRSGAVGLAARGAQAPVWCGVLGFGALQALGDRCSPPPQDWGRCNLLQANISQTDKFQAASGVRDALQWYDAQLRASQQPLVVAPETAIPLLPRHLPEGYWSGLQAHFAQPGRPVALVGMPLGSLDEGYTNSVVALGPEGAAPYRYDKSHLVPFGEFVPPGFVWFVRMMNIPLGDFKSGGWDQPSLAWQGQRLAPNVCYEDLFGEELALRFKDPATAPTALVNVSNIAWFGDTLAVDQHLNISRLRAMELGRPMLRATNTGATAIIDHTGRVTDQLPRFTRGSLTGTFEGRHGLTPFARWAGAWGLGPLWALCCAVVAWAFWKRQRP
jgi:apolipoprotein N-acyltransferase